MDGILSSFVLVVAALVIITNLAVYLHIRSLRCSATHNVFTMVAQYVLQGVGRVICLWLRRGLENDAKNCSRVQEDLLLDILRENAETEYGREYKFRELTNKHEFVANHPLTVYEHFKPYIDRVARGEQRVLISHPPLELGSTSGTTGNRKLLILTKGHRKEAFKTVITMMDTYTRTYPQCNNLQKNLAITSPYCPKVSRSEGGLKITSGAPSPKEAGLAAVTLPFPLLVFDIPTEMETLYAQLLFGLKDRELGQITSTYAMFVYSAMVAMETHWEQLVNDIEQGRLKEDLEISDNIRSDLNKHLNPDPKRAEQLRKEFNKGFDNSIVKRIWPHINLVSAISTGSSALYARKLKERYLGDIPLCSGFYGSTEGMLGVNLWPADVLEKTPAYLMIPSAQFFEFIPVENSEEEQPKTLFAEEVQVGSVYEMVVTTRCGLYRFRMGDVVRIARFYKNTPVLEYQYRKGQLLNVHAEKTNERVMYEALSAALKDTWPGAELVDYTCAESIMLDRHETVIREGTGSEIMAPHYVVFLELKNHNKTTRSSREAFVKQVDQNICDRNPMYESFRDKGGIDLLRVFVLKPGAFEQLKQYLIERNPTLQNRLKIPRVMALKQGLKLLLSNVM